MWKVREKLAKGNKFEKIARKVGENFGKVNKFGEGGGKR
jgi:hypothetical protein